MHELLLRLEEASLELRTLYLVVPGLAATAVGLFLWLGGARYAWIVVGMLGGLLGAAAGSFAAGWLNVDPRLAILGGAVVLAAVALLFKGVVMVLLAAAIFAFIFGSSYLGFTYEPGAAQQDQAGETQGAQVGRLTPEQLELYSDKHEAAKARIDDLWNDVRAWADQKGLMLVLWVAIGAIVGLLIAYVLKKILIALCCSIVGSAFTIVGMVMLFFAKGTPVVSSLQDRPRLLPSIFLVMLLLGLVVQLLLAAAAKTARKTDEDEEETE